MSEQTLQAARTASRAALDEVEELLGGPTTHDVPMLARAYAAGSTNEVEVQPRQLASAMGPWMAGVFLLCYMVLPLFTEAFGLFNGLIWGLFGNAAAFVVTLTAVLGAVMVFKPQVKIRRDGSPLLRADPILAAASGGLLVWAILHNTVDGLTPFLAMSSTELSTFIGLNIIESGLFGMMLASMAKSQAHAFGLGALFQLLFMGTAIFFLL